MMMILMLTSYESVLVWRKRKKVVDKDNRATNSLHLRRNHSKFNFSLELEAVQLLYVL